MRATLAERGRLAGLTAADVSRGLAGRMADLRGLLAGESIPKVRQLIRALGASFTVKPEATADGRRGIRLVSKGTYEKLGDVVLDVVAPTGFEPVFQSAARFAPRPCQLPLCLVNTVDPGTEISAPR